MSNQNSGGNRNDRPPTRKFAKKFIILAVIIFIVMIAGAGLGFLTASIHTMPGLQGEIRPAASSQIFDVNGKLITTIHSVENRLPVSIKKIPKHLQNAFIAAEDARFYQHIGLDPRGILRAVWSNITGGTVSEGGSTITQQLARNALLSQERTLKRKIQEAFLAIQIEQKFTKDEIFEMYMNQIYFGQGAYGVQAASQVYFGKNVEDLTMAEAAMIAGLPQSPNYYSPLNNMKAAKERQAVVLDQMVKYGYLEQKAAAQAKATEIKLAGKGTAGKTAPYFIDYVVQQLIEKYGADAVYKEGLKIYTTLDLDMQLAAEEAMKQLPTAYTEKTGVKQPQGALVAIETKSGYIKAMVGGRGNDQFNRAVLAERQPGSAFKPFVYLAAIEGGMSAATRIDDKPVSYGSWSPINYDGKFRGAVSMRTALEQSLNVPTVKLAQYVGVDKPLYYAQQMGISTLVLSGNVSDRNLAMSLGGLTRGVTPLEIASAYGVIANQGIRAEPVSILKVVDRNGKVIEQAASKEKMVVNQRSIFILTDMMKGVMTRGTGGAANIGRPAAGKTGTTSDYKDAWFVGFTPDLVTAVWMGHDNDGYMPGITGGSIPADIWHDFMIKAAAKYPARDFPRPGGIVSSNVSNKDGMLVTDPKNKEVYSEIFIEGTQPTKPSPLAEEKKEEKDKDGKPLDPNAPNKQLPPPPPKPDSKPAAAPPAAPLPPAPPAKPDPKKN